MTPTREQVIQWAREAGFIGVGGFLGYSTAPFERFAALAFAAGQQAEREKLEQVAYMTKRGAIYGGNCGGKAEGESPLYRIRNEQTTISAVPLANKNFNRKYGKNNENHN